MIIYHTYMYMCISIIKLVQDCSISSALAMEILQLCTKPSRCMYRLNDIISVLVDYTVKAFHMEYNPSIACIGVLTKTPSGGSDMEIKKAWGDILQTTFIGHFLKYWNPKCNWHYQNTKNTFNLLSLGDSGMWYCSKSSTSKVSLSSVNLLCCDV